MIDSAVICDEIIELYTKLSAKDARLSLKDHDEEETNFNEKKTTCKTQNLYILLAFLLIAKALFDKISSKTKTFIAIQLYK